RHRPNLRKTPRGRPVSWQRLRRREGLELRGRACSFRRASKRSSSDRLASLMIASRAARFLAYCATILRRFSSRLIRASFAMIASILERELERGQQRFGFCIGLRGRGDTDVHTPESIDLVVLDFLENDLLFNAHVVVTLAVETLAGDTAEVKDTG